MDANHFLDRDALAVRHAGRYPRTRLLFQELQRTPGRPFVALIGPRGTGKTVMLRQLRARTKDALYVSADTLDRGDRLVDLVRLFLDRYRVQAFFVDEIHYLRDYAAELKEIYDFLPVHDPSLTGADLANIEQLLKFVGRSPIDGINYTSLARNLAITKYKAAQYVGALERASLLRQAFPAGANVLREPKVFMEPPYRLLYRAYDDCIGALREDFFALA